eukprot:scpid105441/ scgid10913/ 
MPSERVQTPGKLYQQAHCHQRKLFSYTVFIHVSASSTASMDLVSPVMASNSPTKHEEPANKSSVPVPSTAILNRTAVLSEHLKTREDSQKARLTKVKAGNTFRSL